MKPSDNIPAWLDGEAIDSISANNRALAYGDGVFETMRVQHGSIKLLDFHLRRLRAGAEVLGFDTAALEHDIPTLLSQGIESAPERCVLKLTLFRALEGRGYRATPNSQTHCLIQLFPMPDMSVSVSSHLSVKKSSIQLGAQPRLAGIKHLNRLEQVMAAMEIGELDDVLLTDANGNVIESSKANLVVLRNGVFETPKLDLCGIRGTALSCLFERQAEFDLSLNFTDIPYHALSSSDGIMLVNSLMGLVAVSELDGQAMPFSDACSQLLEQFNSYLFD